MFRCSLLLLALQLVVVYLLSSTVNIHVYIFCAFALCHTVMYVPCVFQSNDNNFKSLSTRIARESLCYNVLLLYMHVTFHCTTDWYINIIINSQVSTFLYIDMKKKDIFV